MNIYQKIAEVMKDVQYLCKDDHVKFNTTNYKAISEEKVTSTVRESLIKNGIAIVPVAQEHSREGTLSTVNVTYRIQNIEEVDDYVLAVSSGTGADTQDKGVGKAMTYSYKYMLLRTFAIPTGEDPDKISSAELDDKELKKAPSQSASNITKLYAVAMSKGYDKKSVDAGIFKRLNKNIENLSNAEYKEIFDGYNGLKNV